MTTATGNALFLAAVEINSTTHRMRVDEAGVIHNVDLVDGTYYLRGDGAADDLAKIVENALNGSGLANTYSVFVNGEMDPTDRPLTITIERDTGAAAFRVKWDDGTATFPKRLLGFVNTKAAADAADETSTKNPDSAWISNDAYRMRHRLRDWPLGEQETEDGDTSVVRRGDKSKGIVIELRFVSVLRMFEEDTTTALDTDTLEHFIDVNADGRPIEVHEVSPDVGDTHLSSPICDAVTTLVGRFVLGADASRLDARQIDPGVPLFDFDLVMRGSTA